jgi:hypothetical protein
LISSSREWLALSRSRASLATRPRCFEALGLFSSKALPQLDREKLRAFVFRAQVGGHSCARPLVP